MVAVLFTAHAGAEWAVSPPLHLRAVHASVRDVLVRVFIVVIARVLRLRWCLLCGVRLPRCVFLGRRFVVVRGRGCASGCGGRLRRGLVGRFGLGDRAALGISVVISAGSQGTDDCHGGCYSHYFPTNDVGVLPVLGEVIDEEMVGDEAAGDEAVGSMSGPLLVAVRGVNGGVACAPLSFVMCSGPR